MEACSSGQLGTGTQESYCTPQPVELPLGLKVKKLICGPDCSMVITHRQTVFATGSNKLVAFNLLLIFFNTSVVILGIINSVLTTHQKMIRTIIYRYSHCKAESMT